MKTREERRRELTNGCTVRTVAGHSLALTAGVRYVARRPMAERGRNNYPVTIQPHAGSPPDAKGDVINLLSLDEANDFLTEFNNGPTSHDGRVW